MSQAESFEKGTRARIEKAWRAPLKVFGAPFGQNGYTLPNLVGLDWHSVGDPALDNWVAAPSGMNWAEGRKINFGKDATGNAIVYGLECKLTGIFDVTGSGNTITLTGRNLFRGTSNVYVTGNDTVTFVGAETTINGASLFNQGNNTRLIIGEGCMFSHGITVRTSDDHAIIEIDTGRHLNAPSDILIEPHVWLCPETAVFKGVRIGFGSVIANRAAVTSNIPRFSLAGGVPARVLRERISWDRRLFPRSNYHEHLLSWEAEL